MLKRGLTLLFKKRDFGLLMAVQFAAQAGDGIAQTAIAKFIVFGGQRGLDPEGAASVDVLLDMVLFLFVPYTIISPFLGVVIDRWDRRRLLWVANGLRAVAVLTIALIGLGAVGNFAVMSVFLLTLASTRIVLATKAAALPITLDDSELEDGNAISQLGGALFQLGGAGAAFIATYLLPARWIAVIGAVVYGFGALLALRIARAGTSREASTLGREIARVVGSIVSGLREVASSAQASAAITTYFWLRFLWSFSLVGISFIVKELVEGNEILRLAFTGAGGALGAVLGFLVAGRVRQRFPNTALIVVFASSLAGVAAAVLGPLELRIAIILLTFCLGFGFFLAKISLDTLVQRALGDDFRGRAFSLYDIAYNVAWVVAAVVMKIWWEELGSTLIGLMGIVFLAGIAGIAAWFRRAGLLGTRTA
jgi:predicted MFS family arabinose efflux permease